MDENDHSCIAVDGQVLDRVNYMYQWSLVVHFLAPILLTPFVYRILKMLRLDKAWKVGEIIHG